MNSNEVKTAWGHMGEELSSLRSRLKTHVQHETSEEDASEVKDALRKLGSAIDHAVDATNKAVTDPDVREDVRHRSCRVWPMTRPRRGHRLNDLKALLHTPGGVS